MLVLMAIVTTARASPLLELVYGKKARETGELGAVPDGARGDQGYALQPLVGSNCRNSRFWRGSLV